MDITKLNPSPRQRRWLYGVFAAAFALLTYYGVIEPEALPLVLGFLLALFNVKDDGV